MLVFPRDGSYDSTCTCEVGGICLDVFQSCLPQICCMGEMVNTMKSIGIRCGRVVSVGGFETGCSGFDPQSRHYGHGGVPLGKALFLA